MKPLSNWKEIEKLYREKAKKYHPDRGGEGEIMTQLNWAYHTLKEYIFNFRFKFSPEEIVSQLPRNPKEWELWEK